MQNDEYLVRTGYLPHLHPGSPSPHVKDHRNPGEHAYADANAHGSEGEAHGGKDDETCDDQAARELTLEPW